MSFAKIPSALKTLAIGSSVGRLLNHDRGTVFLVSCLKSGLKSRTELALETLALRQQLTILKRNRLQARLKRRDWLFSACLSSVWQRWRESLILVEPATVVRRHRRGFENVGGPVAREQAKESAYSSAKWPTRIRPGEAPESTANF